MKDGLVDRMLARADQDALPAEHPLRVQAAALARTIAGFFADPQTVHAAAFLGTWARARRAWCDYSGEALVP